MFSHVMVGATDVNKANPFSDALRTAQPAHRVH